MRLSPTSSSGNLLTDKLTDKSSQHVPYTTNGQTRTTTYTYNGTGQVLTVQLPRTDVTAKTTFAYTGGTLHQQHRRAFPRLDRQQRDGGRQADEDYQTRTAFKRNSPTRPSGNGRHRASWCVSAGNLTTSLTYDSAGNLTKTTLPDNSYLSYGYDNAHRLTSITNILGESRASPTTAPGT